MLEYLPVVPKLLLHLLFLGGLINFEEILSPFLGIDEKVENKGHWEKRDNKRTKKKKKKARKGKNRNASTPGVRRL